ncbi:MAG: protein tyrosine phosphatase, partial [Verrucomicrobiales bacterium]|nr:protein tyrosine phosphatase [Verrucomicrobiales bacterium]
EPVLNYPRPMSEPQKLLFICSQNRWRSLTAEKMYEGFPGYEVRSAGTEQGARIRVTEGHIGWADKIFVMEKRHIDRLRDRFGDQLAGKEIICIHIDDDYRFMDQDLVTVLREQLRPHIQVPE